MMDGDYLQQKIHITGVVYGIQMHVQISNLIMIWGLVKEHMSNNIRGHAIKQFVKLAISNGLQENQIMQKRELNTMEIQQNKNQFM